MAGQGEGFDYRDLPETDVREARAYYYTLCQVIDRQVGRVLDALERLGMYDNTLVVFTSDHGELLGDHGLWQKGCFPYDELLRVPVLARWPRFLRPGQVVREIFSLADIAPTFLAVAGIDPEAGPHIRDGVNWLPFLTSPASARCAPRDYALVEHIDDPRKLRFRSLLTQGAKFTAWQGAEIDFELTRLDDSPLEDPGGQTAASMNHRLKMIAPSVPKLLRRYAYS